MEGSSFAQNARQDGALIMGSIVSSGALAVVGSGHRFLTHVLEVYHFFCFSPFQHKKYIYVYFRIRIVYFRIAACHNMDDNKAKKRICSRAREVKAMKRCGVQTVHVQAD